MLAALALAVLPQLPGQEAPLSSADFAPGAAYDSAIPTARAVLGHDPWEEITPPDQIVRYFEALALAAPERARLIHYADSWEGRPLVILAISSPERMARLDEFKADLARLAHPEGLLEAEAEELIDRLPVVTALMHSIHGNEISPAGAAMMEAYHLLAAQDDPKVDLVLSESLVLIDPIENPDGRNRFVQANTAAQAVPPNVESYSAEHDEPWPGGRSNHYLFDLNRDMFIQSQVETRGKVRVLLEYWPHVVADLHEMGGDATYFFPPTAPPENPWYGERQLALMELFGRENARAFDRRGFAYFTRDIFDAFYPGYVDMWPMNHGALGMTYEQASARALALERSDGDVMTYGDGVLRHFTAAVTTAHTAAANRERILRDYLEFRREGIEMGSRGIAEYVLHSAHDAGMAERLARMLASNGIEVRRATETIEADGRRLSAAHAFIVPMDQPAHRFARNLLDAHVPMAEDFVQEQIDRRARREPDQIYDLTAWSQSLLWDVEAIPVERPTGAAGEILAATREYSEDATLPEAALGYLLPWGANAAGAVAEALREGIRVRAAGARFTLDGREYPVGTAIVRASENGPELRDALGRIAAMHGAEAVPIDGAYVTEGASLGSRFTRALREPKVLLVYDEPGRSYSVGWARYVLERRYGQAVTVVRASSLGRADLHRFDVLVFPNGNYGGAVSGGLRDRLREWTRGGGTLITMAESTRWAARAGLLETTAERRGGRPEGEDPPDASASDQPIRYLDAIAPSDEAPESVPGAILKVVLDENHWLASGTDGEVGALVEGSRVFRPVTLDVGANVGRYAEEEDLVLSGIVWEEARPQLANKAFLIHQPIGSGQIIAFAEDPNYRAYAEATQLLFMNAVLLGPGR